MTLASDALEKIRIERIVDNRLYRDLRAYELECERIFDRVWMFVGHESEVAKPGDFVTTWLAGTPILVTRDRSGKIRAFYNTCRHRGSLVVRDESGHCSAFRCPYHFWVYSLEGELVAIPGEEAYDGTGFQREEFPLIEAACDSVLGLVFVSQADDPEPLESWLGPNIIEALTKPLANAEFEVFSRSSIPMSVNWKVFAENARDGYHVPFVHPFFRKASPPGTYELYPNGHAVQHLGMDPAGIEPDLWEKLRLHPLPGVEVGEGYIINVFPDLAVTLRSNVVSLDWQRIEGPTSVQLQNRSLGVAGDTEEMRQVRELSQLTWFQNPVELEDVPIFEGQQRGVASRKVLHSIIARGEDKLVGTRGDDNRLRHWWVTWRNLMGTERNSLQE